MTVSLIFLVIKDGREDKQRRINDILVNDCDAKVYNYSFISFVPVKKKDIRVGDIVTVFNNEEVPADILLVNVGETSAFFDTVSLDGEPVLAERYAATEQVQNNEVQSFRGLIMYEEPNPIIHMFRGCLSVKN